MASSPTLGLAGLVLVVTLAGCSSAGGDSGADPTGSAASSATVTPSATATPTDAVASSGGEPGPICDSVPSLEVISSIVGEAVTATADNSRATIEIEGNLVIDQRCDASGASVGAVVFRRSDIAGGNALLAEAAAQGLVVDASWPELPGAVAWANGVTIEHDGFSYSAQAITLDTVGQIDAPAAYDASAALLIAWING